MKNVKFLFCAIVALCFNSLVFAQNNELACRKASVVPFSNCAAILLNDKVLVDEYSPEGQCEVFSEMTGSLKVATVDFSLDNFCLSMPVMFKVAIKNEQTNTLWLYSEKNFFEVPIEDVLKKCQRGDRIILVTVDQEYALPHHEIAINWGC